MRNRIRTDLAIVSGKASQITPDFMSIVDPQIRIVLSRWGTAKCLRKFLQVPVIDISVTVNDILQSIRYVSSIGFKKIAIVTPSNVLFRPEQFVEVEGLDIRYEACEDVDLIPKKVAQMIEHEQFEAIIGDHVAAQAAKQHGVHGHLLESGEESLMLAIETAHNFLSDLTQLDIARLEMKSILNVIGESVFTCDANGFITTMNDHACKILNIQYGILGRHYSECLRGSIRHVLQSKLEKRNMTATVNDTNVVLSHLPMYVEGIYQGAVVSFGKVQPMRSREPKVHQNVHQRGFVARGTFNDIITHHPPMEKIIQKARSYAQSNAAVLIIGETGTGKELFAQSIHNSSPRAAGPFVPVNCAALDTNLLESELFGYEEGTFTGALKGGKPGLFELAHGGTLFLDEIGEISASFQSKLLRAIQEREIRRVGGDRIISVDVRIICATNKHLSSLVKESKFREDLYYRLSVLELYLLPLRFRKVDLIPLAKYFLHMEQRREHRTLTWKSDKVFSPLLEHDWYGNARELQNVVQRLLVSCWNTELCERDVSEILHHTREQDRLMLYKQDDNSLTIDIRVSPVWSEMESALWQGLLDIYGGDRDRLCRDYGISRSTLWRKIGRKNNP
ncbi:sigma 54-interacting transcriptional regulator [Alicyclobacillus fastidiosus]|uniref:Sigma 54-interacting transcriptional regulator n=1 Tax=Alicyclobacillus fastidiosus TaxID=392011 RepID=A0ABY6ZNV4_9BACL|nr:sigma 54-interacting transcriptional regulator [Alicyclobacillus fastidiosus]WAH44530.1 sigma 54-interacting transcriptional regulator [Alicyclobacillus fastidiosus]